MALVYDELRRLARAYMGRERSDHTLEPTALVNEACVRLLGAADASWNNRQHLMSCAAQQMRRVLVDHARARSADKRFGGAIIRLTGSELEMPVTIGVEEILALEEALDRLSRLDPRQCRVVELRYFIGLSEEETAEILGVTIRTVRRDWAHAKAALARYLRLKVANVPGT